MKTKIKEKRMTETERKQRNDQLPITIRNTVFTIRNGAISYALSIHILVTAQYICQLVSQMNIETD